MRLFAFFTCRLPVFLVFFASTASVPASPVEEGPAPEEAEETADLPLWEEGDCRESFDIRLWPARTVRWLEQENLRDLIADPSLAESERARLKHLLGFSRGWRMHSRPGIAEVN